MHSFYYRPGKNAFLAVGMAASALLCGWLRWSNGSWLGLGGMMLFGAGSAKAAHNALNSEPALRLDADNLTVRTTFGSADVLWRDVLGITLETLTYRYYGFIPMGRVEILCIAASGGLTGTRRLRVSASAIELPPGGAAGLLMLVQAAHLAAVGETGAAMAGAGPRGWGVGPENSSGFDPDAAIARYLAAKNENAETAQPALPARAPAIPQRPTFGRRTA